MDVLLFKAKQMTLKSLMIVVAIYDQKNRIVLKQVNMSQNSFSQQERLHSSSKDMVEEHMQPQHMHLISVAC